MRTKTVGKDVTMDNSKYLLKVTLMGIVICFVTYLYSCVREKDQNLEREIKNLAEHVGKNASDLSSIKYSKSIEVKKDNKNMFVEIWFTAFDKVKACKITYDKTNKKETLMVDAFIKDFKNNKNILVLEFENDKMYLQRNSVSAIVISKK